MKQEQSPEPFITRLPNGMVKLAVAHNKIWLTLFYSLPKELVCKWKPYLDLPRCPYEVIRTDKYDSLVNNDAFLEMIWDCYAWTIWQFLDVPDKDGGHKPMPGNFDDYSMDFPICRLCYTGVHLMRLKFEGLRTVSYQALFNMLRGMEIPWPTWDYYLSFIGGIAQQIVKEQNWQPIIDESWLNRTEEDFIRNRASRDKADYYRKWNHTRAKTTSVSLEQMREAEDKGAFEVAEPRGSFENGLLSEMKIAEFAKTLSPRDRQILELKMQGLTDQEIAEKVGFQNHSAVVKRKQQIARRFQEYADEAYSKHLSEEGEPPAQPK